MAIPGLKRTIEGKRYQQPVVEQKEIGFGQTIAQAAAKPFAQLAATGLSAFKSSLNLGQAFIAKAKGDEEEFKKKIAESAKEINLDLKYFGKYGPIGAGEKLTTQLKMGVGTGAEIGSWFVVGGRAVPLLKTLKQGGLSKEASKILTKQLIKEGAKREAKIGMAAGTLGAGGATLAEKESTFGDVIKSSLFGAAIGTVAGAGIGAGIPKLASVISKFSKKTPLMEKTITKITKEPSKLTPEAITKEVPLKEEIGRAKTGVGKSIETKSIERGLTEGFGEVAEYTPITIKEQAKMMSDIMAKDIEKAKRIAIGEEPLPKGLKGATAIKAVEDYAMEQADGALAMKLAKSPLMKETSEAGQTLRLLAEREPDSATAKIREVILERKNAIEKKLKGITSEKVKSKMKDSLKKKIAKTKTSKYTWNNLVEEIVC